MVQTRRGRPFVLAGGAKDWPSASLWSLDWLAGTHGALPVTVSLGGLSVSDGFATRDTTLAAFLEQLGHGDARDAGFLGTVDLGRHIPALKEHTRFPPTGAIRALSHTNYWIGPPGWLSQLHCDFAHNFLVQVRGRKRVELYAPSVVPAADQCRPTWYSCSATWDYPDAPPAPRPPPDFDAVLEPGDILFIPYGWWHRARYLETSIAVNQWWMTPRMLAARAPQLAREGAAALQLRWALFRIARRYASDAPVSPAPPAGPGVSASARPDGSEPGEVPETRG
jgi:hypothetical protein